jgi:hypothetical protein
MRKEIIKSSRGIKNPGTRSAVLSKQSNTTKKLLTAIPVFTNEDDEEYFFEVEDY